MRSSAPPPCAPARAGWLVARRGPCTGPSRECPPPRSLRTTTPGQESRSRQQVTAEVEQQPGAQQNTGHVGFLSHEIRDRANSILAHTAAGARRPGEAPRLVIPRPTPTLDWDPSQGCERSGIHSRVASGGSGGCAASTPQLNKEEEACPRSTWPPNTPPLPSVPTRRA